MARRVRESKLFGRLLPFADVRVLRSILPAWAIAYLRRARELGRRLRNLQLHTPAARRAAARQEVQALGTRPTISIIIPTYRSDLGYLREAIESVRQQHYGEWQLVVVDDGSGMQELERVLNAYAAADPRIDFLARGENEGISAATNAGLELCTGEFVAFLDHDDTLTPDALLRVAQALTADPELDVVYSDSDKLAIRNVRADPFLKPDWSPTYALGAMYIGHLLVVRRSVAEAAGGFDSSFDTIQDFEFMLRVSERTARIHHVPQILYHWRAIPGSIAAGTDQKDSVEELQPRAVTGHLERAGIAARAVPHPSIPHRAELAQPRGGLPSLPVSVIVAEGTDSRADSRRAMERTLRSVLERTEHPELELIGVGRGPAPFADERLRWLEAEPGQGRGAANNAAAAQATGGHLVFLGARTEVVDPGWIAGLLLHAGLPRVAAVGPKLVRPGGRVEQAGFAIGLRDPAAPMLAGTGEDGDGYYGALCCSRDVSALSAECMLVERAAFEALDGFSSEYATEYEDFDLCLRLAREERGCVYAARPRVLTHRTEAERRAAVDIVDRALFVDTWYDELLRGDPFYNPGFAPQQADFIPSGWRERVYRAAAPLGMR